MANYKIQGKAKKIGLFSPECKSLLGPIGAERIVLGPSGTVPITDGRFSDADVEEKFKEPTPEVPETGKRDPARCLTCGSSFKNREEQVVHYQLDWHRYNLKRKLKGLSTVDQDQFETIADDLSSISGSDSDSSPSDECSTHSGRDKDGGDTDNDDNDDDNDDHDDQSMCTHLPANKSPFLHFSLREHRTLTYSMFRCILPHTHSEGTGSNLLHSLCELWKPQIWIILMRSGGHFAGAVYKGSEMVAHKTFHRYTVRAKRGTVQSVRDGQQGGHQPKSAGASLRRYNEAALASEIRNLVDSWSPYVKEASCIFLRTPKYNRGLFVGEKGLFPRGDERVRSIPFQTRRPTLTEVRATFGRLATIYVSSKSETEETRMSKSEGKKEIKETSSTKGGGGESEVGRVSEVATVGHKKSQISGECGSCVEKEAELRGTGEGEEEGRENMAASDDGNVSKKRRKKKRLEQARQVPKVVLPSFIDQLLSLATDSTQSSDQCLDILSNVGLKRVVERQTETCPEEVSNEEASKQLNTLWNGDTVLHTASLSGQLSLIPILMEHGADPTVRNKNGHTPYTVSKNKATRDVFRRFMAAYPSAWDYSAAQVPSPLTEEMERERSKKEAEKRKERKKKKAKEQQERQEIIRKEEDEKTAEQGHQRALDSMTQREKMALAAERRMVSQLPTSAAAMSAGVCSECGQSLLGVVPFERLDYKYCSMDCLKQHRTSLAQHKH